MILSLNTLHLLSMMGDRWAQHHYNYMCDEAVIPIVGLRVRKNGSYSYIAGNPPGSKKKPE